MNIKNFLLIILFFTIIFSNRLYGQEIKSPVSPAIFTSDEIPWEDVGNGMRRKVLFNNNITFVLMEITKPVNEEEKIVTHSHPHEQITFLKEGKILVKLGDMEKVIEAGGIYVIPPDVPHGVKMLSEKIVIIDVFTPTREDFRPKK